MRFAVPDSSSSLDSTFNNEPAVLFKEHKRKVSTVQEPTSGHLKISAVEEGPAATNHVQVSTSQCSQRPLASKDLDQTAKKGPGLRERVSKFFAGPHNAPLEPQRITNEVAPTARSPKFILLQLPSGHTRQPASLEDQPAHTSRLPHVRSVHQEEPSTTDYSTPLRYSREDDEACSHTIPIRHNQLRTQLRTPAQDDPILTPPIDKAYARIVGSSPSKMAMSDDGLFDNRNGGGPTRGLYRHSQTHHKHLMRERTAQYYFDRQAYDPPVEESDNDADWTTFSANSGNSLKDLLSAIPASNIGARQLAALNPGHRGGVIINNTSLERSGSQLTAMDTNNASREWQLQLQPSGSVADANAEFNAVDDGARRFSFSISDHIDISTDPRDRDIPHAVAGTGCEHTSLISSDAFDHVVHAAALDRQAGAATAPNPKSSHSLNLDLPLPPIPTGSDILRAAAADSGFDQTPIAFRTFPSNYPADPPSHSSPSPGRMVSTSWLPLPLPPYQWEKEHEHEHAGETGLEEEASWRDAGSLALDGDEDADGAGPPTIFLPSSTTATTRILHLVRALEYQRGELLQQNQTLLTAVEHARILLRGAEAAYDAAEGRDAARIGELVGECERLREENGALKTRQREDEISRLTRKSKEGFGDVFHGLKEV